MNTERDKSYQELHKRIEREKELAIIERKMELKRLLKQKRQLEPKRIQKGSKSKAPIYEFKFERKK